MATITKDRQFLFTRYRALVAVLGEPRAATNGVSRVVWKREGKDYVEIADHPQSTDRPVEQVEEWAIWVHTHALEELLDQLTLAEKALPPLEMPPLETLFEVAEWTRLEPGDDFPSNYLGETLASLDWEDQGEPLTIAGLAREFLFLRYPEGVTGSQKVEVYDAVNGGLVGTRKLRW